jgi:hypothetical protein
MSNDKKLTPEEEAIFNAKPGEEPDRAKIVWPKAQDREVRKAYNDLEFLVFGKPLSKVPVTWALSPSTKYHHVGTLRFETHRNSYRYGPELIIAIESPIYPKDIETRAPNNGLWRLEICVSMREVYDCLMEALPQMHARLNGIR